MKERSFNPRTHTGCDNVIMHIRSASIIVSIHAPTRGATIFAGQVRNLKLRFNPRTHTGCDHHSITHKDTIKIVSIHAPTRGATLP